MSNAQKTPFSLSLHNLAKLKIENAFELIGRSLPCSVVTVSGSTVTIKFEIQTEFTLPQVTVPIAESIYIRQPIQAGDKGLAIPCNTQLGFISGLGTGTSDLNQVPNLSSLVYLPISNSNWTAVDSNTLVLTGLTDIMTRNNNHQLKLEDEYTAWQNIATMITQINTNFATIGPLLTTPTVLPPVTTIANPVKTRVP